MKKYKLIKRYPGSDPVGTIVTGKGEEGWYSKGPGGENIRLDTRSTLS